MTRPARLDNLEAAFARIGLPVLFVLVDLLWVANPAVLGIDARHYQRAANAWLAGGDPWSVTEMGVPFAAGPHTLLFYAPTSLVPVEIAAAIWMALGGGAAVWLVRHLGLPWWWLAFPPLFHAVWNGNPHSVVVALLVVGAGWASAVAAALKLYALLPLLFRPRQLVIAGIVLAATLLVVPWGLYLDEGLGVTSHLSTAWNGSAWRIPILVPPTLLALWVIRRKGAEWFIVPAVFPAIQFYYVSMVMPAVARRPLLAGLLALPIPLMTPAVVGWLAYRELVSPDRRTRSAASAVPGPATTPVDGTS